MVTLFKRYANQDIIQSVVSKGVFLRKADTSASVVMQSKVVYNSNSIVVIAGGKYKRQQSNIGGIKGRQ